MRPIDADALIEKCGGWYVDECTESGFIGTLENLLATEPTIQPQSTTGQLNDGAQSTAQSTDLIDRQAAIDAVDAIGYIATMPDGDKCIRISAVKYTLSMLPPVQPEVLACGNGELVAKPEPTDIDAKEAVYNLAEKIGIHQLFALTVELRGEPIQPELTYEQVEEYCKKRCLHVVTADFFESTKPQRLGHWVDGRCNECGGQAPFWVMASTYYESDFCPHCGAKMKGEPNEAY